MALPRVLHGTWDEIAAHADELKRHPRLTLMIAPETEPTPASDQTDDEAHQELLRQRAAQLFAEADATKREPGPPHTDPHEIAFGEIMVEKYRKMGLKV